MLALDIEWLMDVCFATHIPADSTPEWPPQPDRVFSALVASWGAHDTPSDERAALSWLEELPPPMLSAVRDSRPRDVVTAYVPPNDPRPDTLLPDRRRRQPRNFPATALPSTGGGPHVRLTWHAAAGAHAHLAALSALARDTSYIGHSAALVRCAFSLDPPEDERLQARTLVGAPYPGRLQHLEALYRRHTRQGDAHARPPPVRLGNAVEVAKPAEPASVFGQHWLVLAYQDGDRPDLRAAAIMGKAMRNALLSHWRGLIPEWLSGHCADGTPTRQPHLAVIPLANVGFDWSDGRWLGLALILPRAIETEWTGAATPTAFDNSQQLGQRLREVLQRKGDATPEIPLWHRALGRLTLGLVDAPERHRLESLRPQRYQGPATRWSTVTPIALDRHPKGDDTRTEAARIIAESAVRIGLPPPRVIVHKHAAISGAPSARPPTGAPRWTGWQRPAGGLSGRPLTHATLHFAEPVRGPVILGAGRFVGLGLCLPVDEGA